MKKAWMTLLMALLAFGTAFAQTSAQDQQKAAEAYMKAAAVRP